MTRKLNQEREQVSEKKSLPNPFLGNQRRVSRTCCTKDVSSRELPHSCDELEKTTREYSHSYDDIRLPDPSHVYVEHREHERRRRKGEDTTVVGVFELYPRHDEENRL